MQLECAPVVLVIASVSTGWRVDRQLGDRLIAGGQEPIHGHVVDLCDKIVWGR